MRNEQRKRMRHFLLDLKKQFFSNLLKKFLRETKYLPLQTYFCVYFSYFSLQASLLWAKEIFRFKIEITLEKLVSVCCGHSTRVSFSFHTLNLASVQKIFRCVFPNNIGCYKISICTVNFRNEMIDPLRDNESNHYTPKITFLTKLIFIPRYSGHKRLRHILPRLLEYHKQNLLPISFKFLHAYTEKVVGSNRMLLRAHHLRLF
jgi:hypothetical protein